MAKKQTRRSTTLSREVYEAAKAHSFATGEPLARMIERAVRKELEMPEVGPAVQMPVPTSPDLKARIEARAAKLSITPDQLLQHIVTRALDAERWPLRPPWPARKTT